MPPADRSLPPADGSLPPAAGSTAEGIYGAALGALDLGRLAAPVARMHVGSSSNWSGEFAVGHSRKRVLRAVQRVLPIPPASPSLPVALAIERGPTEERWVRTMGRRRFATRQVLDGGLATELIGPTKLGLRFPMALSVGADGSLTATTDRVTVALGPLRLRLPDLVSPKVVGVVRAAAHDGVEVDVRIRTRLTGIVLTYNGVVGPEPVAS